ncbi:hypothetical protein VYU27_010136 [Nannochloropsis oceanica]
MATVTGYVTVVLAWGFLTRDITSSSSHSPSLLDTKDNEGSTIYLGWIALFVVGIFLIYVASFGLHSARKVSIHHLLRYFWVATLGIAPLVLVTACAFDFYDISRSKKGGKDGRVSCGITGTVRPSTASECTSAPKALRQVGNVRHPPWGQGVRVSRACTLGVSITTTAQRTVK